MLEHDKFQEAVNELVVLYQQGDIDKAKEVEKVRTIEIRGDGMIKPGEQFNSAQYHQELNQQCEYHRLVAEQLAPQPKLYSFAIEQTVKALKVETHYDHDLRRLEKQAGVLHISRLEHKYDIADECTIGDIGFVLGRRDEILEEVRQTKERIELIFAPLLGRTIRPYSNDLAIPYADQLVMVTAEYHPYSVRGKLIGIEECVVNVGVESLSRIHEPLRIYPNNAYKQFHLCLDIDPSLGKLKEDQVPKGISRSLVGLDHLYIPVYDLDGGWNGIKD